MAERDAAGAEQLTAARGEAEQLLAELDGQLAAARQRDAELSETVGAAANRLEAARRAGATSADLDPDAPSRTCGQPLGEAHAEVRRRQDELAAATAAYAEAVEARRAAAAVGKTLAERRTALAETVEQARAGEYKATALAEAAAAWELAAADVAARRRALDYAPTPA